MTICARTECATPFTRTHSRQLYCSAECKRIVVIERRAAYYAVNHEKESKRHAAAYVANSEKFLARNARWRNSNPERFTALCAAWRAENLVGNYNRLSGKFGLVCADCTREYPMPLYHYHHLDPTKKEGRLRVEGWVWERVEAYVEGTVQLCPTCHALRHLRSKDSLRCEAKYIAKKEANYAKLVALFGQTCVGCKNEYPMEVYHYHHLDPSTKTEILHVGHWSWPRVETYVQGCAQLCPTCHALRHYDAGNGEKCLP